MAPATAAANTTNAMRVLGVPGTSASSSSRYGVYVSNRRYPASRRRNAARASAAASSKLASRPHIIRVAPPPAYRAVGDELGHVGHRHERQVADEEQVREREESDRAGEGRPIPDRRDEVAPGGRDEVAMQADDHDVDALDPHADVDQGADDEEPDRAAPDPRHPQRLDD